MNKIAIVVRKCWFSGVEQKETCVNQHSPLIPSTCWNPRHIIWDSFLEDDIFLVYDEPDEVDYSPKDSVCA